MKIRKRIPSLFVCFVIAITITLCSCERITPESLDAEIETSQTAIPIGMVLSLTGKDAEPYGLPMQRGFELAREAINESGHLEFMFVTVDDKSSEAGAIVAVEQLISQDVPVILGIAISDYLEDAFPIAQDHGVVALSSVSAAAGLSGIGDYVFRTGLAVDIFIPGGVLATQEKLGYQKVATIYDGSDTYSISANMHVRAALEVNGIEILTEETFETGDTDFSEQLMNIVAVAPDAVFISALSPEMIEIIKQAESVGFPDLVNLIAFDLTVAEIEKVGAAAEGVVVFTGWTALSNVSGNQAFVKKYQAKYGHEPVASAAQSYASLYILANAIENAGSVDAKSIRDALAATMNFPTILGDFSFDSNGEAVYDPIVLIVKDGKLQLFQ